MKTPCIVPAAVVAGLAVAAALVTANFIQAADAAVNGPAAVIVSAAQTTLTVPTQADWLFANAAPDSFPSVGKMLEFACPATGPFLYGGHTVVDTLAPAMADGPNPIGPEASAVEASPVVAVGPSDAKAAADAARDEAELNAMFAVAPRANPARTEAAKNAQGERGKQVYLGLCYACHQPDGRGLPGAFPMLAQSDYMVADRTRAIRIVLHGLEGPVTVNGQTLNSAMPGQGAVLNDQQVADVLTYVFNAWGNPGGAFKASEVEKLRQKKL